MRKIFISALMLAMAFVWSNSSLHGQASESKPSLDETVTYMKSFLDQHGCSTMDGIGGLPLVWCSKITSSDRCILQLSRSRTMTMDSDGSQRVSNFPSYTANLSMLDPTSVKTGPFSPPSEGLAVFLQLSSSVGEPLKLPVDDAEMATHLINALTHAITLCGGKKAAF